MGDRGRVAPPGVTRQSAPPRQQGLFFGQWRTPQQLHINAAQQPQQVAGTDVAASVRIQRVKRSVKIAVNVQAAGNICSGQAELTRGAQHEPYGLGRANLDRRDPVPRPREAPVIRPKRHRRIVGHQRREDLLEPRPHPDPARPLASCAPASL